MIGYVTLGTNDLERAIAFYDELLAVIGAQRFMGEWGLAPALEVFKKAGAKVEGRRWRSGG